MFRGITLVFILLLTHQAWGMGLGQASLHSHLGEPLDVRVPVLLAQGETLDQFKIQLASPQEYRSLEQMLPSVYATFRVTLQRGSSPEVHIVSSTAVDEAILVLVLKVKKGRGVFYKKIQLLLDASDIQPKKKAAWVNQPTEQVVYTPIKRPENYQQVKTVSPMPSSGWARRSSYGPVQRGDSLSEIAYRLRKDKRYTNHQVSLALFDANPQAFQNHDINRLKQGAFLQVPDDQAVQDFIQSPRYQALKGMHVLSKQQIRRKKNTGKKQKVPKQSPKQAVPIAQKPMQAVQYHGKISLGLTEDLTNIPTNPEVLKRLDKLEPMYQKAMASNLRMDDMNEQVNDLAKEVSLIHRKLDALAKAQQSGAVQGKSISGWFWFMVLLVLNVFLIAAYFYRRKMKSWQQKLMEARHQRSEINPASSAPVKTEVHHHTQGEDANLEAESEPVTSGLNMYDSMLEDDVSGEHLAYKEVEEEKPEKVDIFHPSHSVNMFEEMVHKKDWVQAEKYYELMDEKQQEKPRMQALWVQTLHGANKVIERNLTLLNLSKAYEYDQWHRFTSYFDQSVWQEMQDEKIINYSGKIVESEMDRINQEIMLGGAGVQDGVADVALEDPDSLPDFQPAAYFDGYDPMKDDAVVDMGVADDADVEPIMDDTSQESDSLDFAITLDVDESIDNGENDTVVVTPDMLAAMEQKKYEIAQESVEQNQELSLDSDQGVDMQDSKDKGDTVLVSREKMDKFRKYLDK